MPSDARAALAPLAVAFLAIAGGAAGIAAAPPAAAVTIEAMQFKPSTLEVRPGQSVTWHNQDPFPHTVTAPGSFDSKSIPAGGSWTFTPRKAGDYAYQCTLHPTMSGHLTVR